MTTEETKLVTDWILSHDKRYQRVIAKTAERLSKTNEISINSALFEVYKFVRDFKKS